MMDGTQWMKKRYEAMNICIQLGSEQALICWLDKVIVTEQQSKVTLKFKMEMESR